MTSRKIIILIALIAVVLLKTASFFSDNKQTSNISKNIPLQLDTQNLSEGDLIFRKGHDLVSRLVLSQGIDAQFSHVGMLLKRGENISVIHTLPGEESSSVGVQEEPLNSFVSLDNATAVAVYRIAGMDHELTEKIKHFLLQQLGKPFDDDFLMSTDDSLYCTELVVKAMEHAGFNILKHLTPIKVMLMDELVIPPDYLRHSPLLEPIAFIKSKS